MFNTTLNVNVPDSLVNHLHNNIIDWSTVFEAIIQEFNLNRICVRYLGKVFTALSFVLQGCTNTLVRILAKVNTRAQSSRRYSHLNQQQITAWFDTVEQYQQPTITVTAHGNYNTPKSSIQSVMLSSQNVTPSDLKALVDFPYYVTKDTDKSVLVDVLRRYCLRKNDQSALQRLRQPKRCWRSVQVLAQTEPSANCFIKQFPKVADDITNSADANQELKKAKQNQNNYRSNGKYLDGHNSSTLRARPGRAIAQLTARLVFDKSAFNRGLRSFFRLSPPTTNWPRIQFNTPLMLLNHPC